MNSLKRILMKKKIKFGRRLKIPLLKMFQASQGQIKQEATPSQQRSI